MKKPLTGAELNELVSGLNKMARNLWWTWDQEAQDLFLQLSPRSWQNLFHNAVAVLREVSEYELRVHLQDTEFAGRVRAVLAEFVISVQYIATLASRPWAGRISDRAGAKVSVLWGMAACTASGVMQSVLNAAA